MVKMDTLYEKHSYMYRHLSKLYGQAISLLKNKEILKHYKSGEFNTRFGKEMQAQFKNVFCSYVDRI